MRYLRKFEKASDYKQYLEGDDIWLPRVSLIVNAGAEARVGADKWEDDGPTWVDFSRLGTEFIQVANQTMYFNDQIIDGIEYKAFLNGDSLCIQSKDISTGQFTDHAKIDVDAGEIVVNYPDGTTAAYKLP